MCYNMFIKRKKYLIMTNSVKNIRLQNRKNVLRLIASEPNLTRSDIATKLDVSLMTITNVIEDLLHFNLISEEKSTSSIGRTPTKISLSKKNTMLLCVDLTKKEKVSYTFYKVNGEEFLSNNIQFNESLYKENFLRLFEQLSKEIISAGIELGGIGICINGTYYKESDSIKNCNISELQFSNIYKIFSKFFNCKNVVVDNVNNLLAKALREDEICLLNLGNNISLSYLSNGESLIGFDRLFGQIGNCLVGDSIYKTTLNSLVSVTSIEKYIETLGLNYKIDEIITRYNAGDDRFSQHLNFIFGITNSLIYNLFWQYNPSKIYLISPSNNYANAVHEKFLAFCNAPDETTKSLDFRSRLIRPSATPSYLAEICEIIREQYIGNLIN